MISLFLPLLLSINTADARHIKVIFRQRPPNHQVCHHHDIHDYRHHRHAPEPRPGGTWVWVPKHKVKHNKHYHWVPAHWEFRKHKRR
jgi:hypothetical protein